jgi:hypothetical protein
MMRFFGVWRRFERKMDAYGWSLGTSKDDKDTFLCMIDPYIGLMNLYYSFLAQIYEVS